MINQKFKNDILNLQNQFSVGVELAEHIKLKFKPIRIYVCGMGSSFFMGLSIIRIFITLNLGKL